MTVMEKRPLPENPPEWTAVQRWIIDTMGDHSTTLNGHTRSLGVIEGILKVALPLGVTIMGGLLTALLVLQIR
jgi:hypothetical protein